MRKMLVVAAVLYGTYWYASRRFDFHDTLVYAKKNPGKAWAPAADYYVGLVYYQRAEYPKAQEAFTQLLTDHATSHYRAKALLRLSEVAENNRDYPVARESLERFLEEFPKDPGARVAEKRLELVKFK